MLTFPLVKPGESSVRVVFHCRSFWTKGLAPCIASSFGSTEKSLLKKTCESLTRILLISSGSRTIKTGSFARVFQDSTSGRLVGAPGHLGAPGAAGGGDCHELEEIAVVSSSADPLHLKYGSELAGNPLNACNGPRLVPDSFSKRRKRRKAAASL
ncbi:hypothetical protein HUJ04_005902 [Dendroctonus ponderosae]|nr:hypothetical protein HUJ04_005902 [Dendroctonus ponderosae]